MSNLVDLEQEFLTYAVEQAHPFVRECADERLRDNLLEDIRTDLDRISDREFAKWHGSGRKYFGEPVERFNNRVMQFGSIRMIVGIRFRNLDNNYPFVGIEQSSVAIGTIEDRTSLLASLAADYRAFRPFGVRFYHPSHLPFHGGGTRGDVHVLIAPARSMLERNPPPGIDRVSSSPAPTSPLTIATSLSTRRSPVSGRGCVASYSRRIATLWRSATSKD